jgi:transmembrane sensor
VNFPFPPQPNSRKFPPGIVQVSLHRRQLNGSTINSPVLPTNQQLKELLLSHIRGTISEKDRETLFVSLADDQFADQWKLLIKELSSEMRITGPYNEAEWEPMIQDIFKEHDKSVTPVHRIHLLRHSWFRYAAAAVLIIAVSVAVFLSSDRRSSTTPGTEVANNSAGDVKAPVNNKAFITLADGRRVYLDSTKNGELAQQANVTLVKLANGQIAYQTGDGQVLTELKYNTLSNPRGSNVIDMTLADGSRVWLNAGSSVRYPIAFVGNERKVEITGEAYFEVAHNAGKPFYVTRDNVEVKVLGTHFNVNAYEDEADIKVTLLEGSVKVSGGMNAVTLKPGQQAQAALAASSRSESGTSIDRQVTLSNSVDLDQVMAWKNGKFQFDRTPLPVVMRQLSRWYDIEVVYEKGIPNVVFAGEMGRDLNLSQVLKVLSKMEVNFKIEVRPDDPLGRGRKLIVLE